MLRKQDKQNRQKGLKLKFTGERLIPEINKGTAFFYEHIARYVFAMQAVKNKVVLDAGCGTGYGSYILSKYGGAQKIYAADISEESFSLSDQIVYTPPLDTKESQYLLAVCSNKPFAQLKTITITTKKVDNINIEKGLLNLELQLNLAGQADELQKTLNTIKSSKFFKVWQTYCRVRDSIFKNQ